MSVQTQAMCVAVASSILTVASTVLICFHRLLTLIMVDRAPKISSMHSSCDELSDTGSRGWRLRRGVAPSG